MLDGFRVLDLTDENGFLCGKILADLGADVIKVEPPGGSPARNMRPFWKDIHDPEKNLWWFAYNSNKRGVSLDIESAEGKELFRKLVKTADCVVESFPPGYLDGLGLGYDDLCKLRPSIIMTSITPFGQDGPYRDYRSEDIVTMGMTGLLYQTGDHDTPPTHMTMPQSYMHGGADGAVATMLAYYHREQTGEGQHADVSQQQSVAWFLANAVPIYELNGIVVERSGAFRWSLTSTQRQVWECKDGYVFFNIIGGRGGAKTLRELVKWMDGEGLASDFLKSMDWETLDMFKATQETVDEISRPIEVFFKAHTKQEISIGARQRNISICPLSGMGDLLEDKQLAFRNFWTDIEHPELGETVTYPREFAKSNEESFATRFRAPLIGEHNAEVYRELGLSDAEVQNLKQAGVI